MQLNHNHPPQNGLQTLLSNIRLSWLGFVRSHSLNISNNVLRFLLWCCSCWAVHISRSSIGTYPKQIGENQRIVPLNQLHHPPTMEKKKWRSCDSLCFCVFSFWDVIKLQTCLYLYDCVCYFGSWSHLWYANVLLYK